MRVLLVNTYELGHQPIGIAAPAAVLRDRGHELRALDLSVDQWDPEAVAWADVVAFSVPMHTAMRIAREAIARTRAERPELPIAAYGLYAPMLEDVADTDVVLVQVGGGGLVSGIATAVKGLKPEARVVAIEPEDP